MTSFLVVVVLTSLTAEQVLIPTHLLILARLLQPLLRQAQPLMAVYQRPSLILKTSQGLTLMTASQVMQASMSLLVMQVMTHSQASAVMIQLMAATVMTSFLAAAVMIP